MRKFARFWPGSNHWLVWFPSYAWLATSAITPFIYALKLRREQVEPKQRDILVTQETCRQLVSGAIGFLTSAAGIKLGGLLGRNAVNKTLSKVIWGALANCLGYAVVRPVLGTDLFVYWMRRKGMAAFTPEQKPHPPVTTSRSLVSPEQRIQHYFSRIQARSALNYQHWDKI